MTKATNDGNYTPIKQRLQITFGKFDTLKYTGNLDLAKMWERVLRRAQLPVLYTEGFNPRPRLQLASALPLGITSECEILDVSLREKIETTHLIEQLLRVSPPGLHIYNIETVDVRSPALQTLVRSAEYRLEFTEDVDPTTLREKIDHILNADVVIKTRTKRGKEISSNIRPLIYDLHLDDNNHLIMHVAVGNEGNVRPEDILQHMGLEETYPKIHRYRLHLAPSSEQE